MKHPNTKYFYDVARKKKSAVEDNLVYSSDFPPSNC